MLLQLQATKAVDLTLLPFLRSRLQGSQRRTLTRLAELAARPKPPTNERLAEAKLLAQAMRRELQLALAEQR